MQKPDPIRLVEFGIVVISATFGAYLWLDSIHADKKEFKKAELELEQRILTNEINRDNFARRSYESAIKQGTASEGDKVRLEYIEMQIDNRLSEKAIVDRQLSELKDD